MIHFRPCLNSDIPAIAKLWNRGAPATGAARPLNAHEFDAQVTGRTEFDRQGLIVAERDRNLVGFVHAGFGPESLFSPPLQLNREMGTIGMLIVAPGTEDEALEAGLIDQARGYLLSQGAKVIYAGGQNPLNPFYWGIYGGSEWAGIVDSHISFHRAVIRAGFEPVSTTVQLEADLTQPETRDPKAVLIRRHTKIEMTEDALPASWWESLAIGEFRPTLYRLLLRATGYEVARATTWDMSWFSRIEGRLGIGLIDMEVESSSRRKGYGRFLVGEMLKQARTEAVSVASVQTRATNTAAIALYELSGFQPVGTSTLYRLPG